MSPIANMPANTIPMIDPFRAAFDNSSAPAAVGEFELGSVCCRLPLGVVSLASGIFVGVGAVVGVTVGTIVGKGVGTTVGATVGVTIGTTVGVGVGVGVGVVVTSGK